jgi:hypothetical protein
MLRSLALPLLLSCVASAQVRVATVGTQFGTHQRIDAEVTNTGEKGAA